MGSRNGTFRLRVTEVVAFFGPVAQQFVLCLRSTHLHVCIVAAPFLIYLLYSDFAI